MTFWFLLQMHCDCIFRTGMHCEGECYPSLLPWRVGGVAPAYAPCLLSIPSLLDSILSVIRESLRRVSCSPKHVLNNWITLKVYTRESGKFQFLFSLHVLTRKFPKVLLQEYIIKSSFYLVRKIQSVGFAQTNESELKMEEIHLGNKKKRINK